MQENRLIAESPEAEYMLIFQIAYDLEFVYNKMPFCMVRKSIFCSVVKVPSNLLG